MPCKIQTTNIMCYFILSYTEMIPIQSILSNSKERFGSKILCSEALFVLSRLTSAAKDILCEYTPAILISKLFWVFEFAKAVPYRDILCTWLVIQGDSSLQNLSVSASFRLCQLILSMDALVGSFSSVTTESVFIGWSNPKIKTPNQLFWNQWI